MKKRTSQKNILKSIFQSRKGINVKAGGFRHEIIGLVFIVIGILLALIILSYHQSDPIGILQKNNIYEVKNLLGQFGATIAAPLFQWTLGFPILVFPLLLLITGYILLLNKPLRSVARSLILLIIWSILLSILLAFPEAVKTFGNFHTFYPSGFMGGVIAAYMVKVFGKFGAIFIIFMSTLILIVLTFRLHISRISIGMSRLINSIFVFMRGKITRVRVSINDLISNRRTAKIKSKKEKVKERYAQDELRKDPFYQPSLPSEKQVLDADNFQEIEVVSQIKEKQGEVLENISITQGKPGVSEVEIEGIEQEKEGNGLGFEVQEAHREKELDYDSLLRDSLSKYQFPSTELLIEHDLTDFHLSEDELKMRARLVEETLAQFSVKATVNRVVEGPVITLYEVKPAQGVKINQIVSLADDLALAMRAKGIRMIAPIPGKAAIGIEIPNQEPSIVHFKSIVRSETFLNFKANLPLGIGKTISGEVHCEDLTKMPHLLMAGATGSGKSVGINTMIASLLYRVPPSDLKVVMIDPKKLELGIYGKLKDHYLAVCPELDEIVITHPQNAIMILRSVVNEMENRYDKLAEMGVREMTHYNQKIEEYRRNGETSDEYRKLPYLVVVIDELADLMLSAARDVEEPITRLAQMARAVGIHLIVATQRPSVDIITGLIKANFPARIAYQVATRPDSKVILDMYGAEKLIGNGDMLFMPPGKIKLMRLQNPLITTEEVERVIKHIRKQPKFPAYELKLIQKREKGPATAIMLERDELFEKAKETVIRYQQGSVSLLQRKLKIGYARAARIIDELEEAGIVGPPTQEGKARDVLTSGFTPESN